MKDNKVGYTPHTIRTFNIIQLLLLAMWTSRSGDTWAPWQQWHEDRKEKTLKEQVASFDFGENQTQKTVLFQVRSSTFISMSRPPSHMSTVGCQTAVKLCHKPLFMPTLCKIDSILCRWKQVDLWLTLLVSERPLRFRRSRNWVLASLICLLNKLLQLVLVCVST